MLKETRVTKAAVKFAIIGAAAGAGLSLIKKAKASGYVTNMLSFGLIAMIGAVVWTNIQINKEDKLALKAANETKEGA